MKEERFSKSEGIEEKYILDTKRGRNILLNSLKK